MNLEELNVFLEANPAVEWAQDDDGTLYFRHANFGAENEKIKVEPKALEKLTPEKLEKVLVGGRNVDHITRITGYFSKVSGWNKGKQGELKDRQKTQM